MQFTTSKQALVAALALLTRVVERKNTIPILSNVRLAVTGRRLTITATDLDIDAQTSIDVRADGEGAITVGAHMLHDIARKMAEGAELTLAWETGASQAQLRSGRARFNLMMLPADAFPDFATGEMSHSFTLPSATLARMLDKVGFAISTEETRYYLNGIYLHHKPDDNTLVAVATDGHRLSRLAAPAPAGTDGMPGVIIPRKTVGELARLVKDGEGDVQIEVSPAKCRFSRGSTTLTSKLIDGTFPDYERVVPRNNQKHMLINRKALGEAVDRVATVSSDKSRAIRFDVTEARLMLTVQSPDAGTAEDEMDADYKAEPVTIGFNSSYVSDMLAVLEGEDVTFSFDTAGSPTLVTSASDDNLTIVIMPMRV